jgi:hypothetical protein
MGTFSVMLLASQVEEGTTSLENAIGIHLTSNCYPPLPDSLIPCCIRALKNAQKGLWDKNILLPKGITYRGKRTAPTEECIEAWRIKKFIGVA